jgi:hypothetical protein
VHPFFSSFEGFIPLLGGIAVTLLAYGYLKPKDSEQFASWQKRFGPMMRVVGPLTIIYGLFLFVMPPTDSTSIIPLTAYADPIVEAIKKLNEGPKMVDSMTRFDRATAGPGQRLTIEETVVTVKASDISEEAWQNYLPQLRKNVLSSQIGMLTQRGITVVYRYYGNDGVLIHEVVFSPQS